MIAWRKGLMGKGLVAAVLLLLVVIVATARPGNRSLYPAAGDTVTVYVVNNGFHTDIALPADAIMAHGGALADAGRASGGKAWLLYGWGDAGFYTQSGVSAVRLADGARALFRPGNPSVIRVFGVSASPDRAFAGHVAASVVLSRAGFDALTRHMEASFTTRDGALQPVAVNDPSSVFFQSREHFSALRTCNNWASDQLAAAGLPTTPAIDGLAPLFALDLSLRAHVRRD